MAKQKKQRKVVSFTEVKTKMRETTLRPKTKNQEQYIINLLDEEQDVVIAHGPAGSGKTYLAMLAAIKHFRLGLCDRIVLTRPAVGVEDEKHGFLPGTLEEKMAPWTKPLLDVLREYYTPPEIQRMLEDQIVEISPLAFMRGRTFKDSWIIADEMQSSTVGQMKMLLTRIGEGSKMIITGDIEQTDRKGADNGFRDIISRLEADPISRISLCELNGKDIQRHRIINDVLKIYRDVD